MWTSYYGYIRLLINNLGFRSEAKLWYPLTLDKYQRFIPNSKEMNLPGINFNSFFILDLFWGMKFDRAAFVLLRVKKAFKKKRQQRKERK